MIKNTEHNKRVVIAEDSPTQAEKLKFSMQNLGMEVFHGLNGKIACDLVREVDPVMIISDVVMPEMNGYELVKFVRSYSEWDHIPIVLLTSQSDLNDVLLGLECGADSYIMKPFNEHYLLSRLNQIMENRELLAERKALESIEFQHLGKNYQIHSSAPQILNLLFSSYESAMYRNIELEERENELTELNRTLSKEVELRKAELKVELDQIMQAELDLKKSEASYRGLVDNSHVSIYMSTLDGKIVLSNKAFREMLEYHSEEELARIRFHDLFEDPHELERMIEQFDEKSSLTEYETRLITRDRKNYKDVLMNANISGESVSGVIIDITERKKAEKQMSKTRIELVRSKELAETSETLKNAFLANMSNEILNPLNSLIGFTKLIETEGLSSESITEYADQINKSGNNLVNVIENIIDIAKVESGELVIKKGPCKINKILLDLYSSMSQKLVEQEKGALNFVVKRENKDPDFTLYTEPYRLKRILTNLLNNAIKYTESGGITFGYKIQISSSNFSGNTIQFFVEDSGKGIRKENVHGLFDRFKQGENVYKKKSDGAGLGLSLSKAYVELLGGKIWCESIPGEGSTFYFSLPLEEMNSDNRSKDLVSEKLQLAGRDQLKILIAEDNPSNYYLLEALLSELEPTIIWAKNGKEAVDMFRREENINLILMDLHMPVKSGQDAVKEIRSKDESVPIIAQTAFAREEERSEILALGCTSFLTKPIMKEALFREIENLFT